MPYWMIIQSFEVHANFDRRLPSESDLRLQMFVPLTYGYTGIIYFTYDVAFERGLIETNGKPNRLYHVATKTNREVRNLGQAMRFLTSTHIGCVPGRHDESGKSIPNELRRSTRSLDLEKQPIRGVVIDSPGKRKDVMLGLFRDDKGGRYCMLTNLWHNAGASAADRALPVTIKLAPEVKEIHRLNRLTGKAEPVPIRNGTAKITLPGGTGDLLKINDGDFPGLTDSH